MDFSSTTSHLNGDHAEANGSSQACFSSIDTKSIDSSHSLDIKNGDYIDVKQNVFTTPPKLHKKIITITGGTSKAEPEEMDATR